MTDPTRFLIAGTQRTGTTLLRTSLSSHPAITCHGEVFKLGRVPYSLPGGYWAYSRSSLSNRMSSIFTPRRSCQDFLRQLYGARDTAAVGLKLMLNQCDERSYLWPLLAAIPVRSILVTRRNYLKTLLSRRTAAPTGIYPVSGTLPAKASVSSWEARPIRLDAATIVAELDAIEAEAGRWRALLSDMRCLEIEYESYVRDQPSWNARVLEFLDVAQTPLISDLKKVNPDRLADLIVNYDEIAELVSRSSHAACLDEDS